ncbi:MAG: ABC transporter substrate-binding protein [Spirochaetota bacterium]
MFNCTFKKAVILTVIVLIIVVLPLAAAGQKEETVTPEVSSEPVKISFWYALSGDSGEAFNKLVAAFNSRHPSIKVDAVFSGKYADTAQKVTAALASNTLPNGGIIPAGPIFTGGRGNYKLLDYLDMDKDFNKEDFYPVIWDYSRYQGKICAIPYNISTPLMYYNKSNMKDSGLDTGKPPLTWEELLKYAKKITKDVNSDGQPDIWGVDTTDTPWIFKSFLLQNDNMIIDSKTLEPLFTNREGIETAGYWKSLVDEKAMPVGMHKNAEKQFLGGNLGLYLGSSNRIGTWSGQTGFDFGAAYLPKNKKKAVAIGGAVLVLFPHNDIEDKAAWELIKWLVLPENIAQFSMETGYIPTRKSTLVLPEMQQFLKDNPLVKVAFEQLQYGFSYWHFEQMGEMDRILGEVLEKIERNVLSPADGMQAAAKELKDLIGN